MESCVVALVVSLVLSLVVQPTKDMIPIKGKAKNFKVLFMVFLLPNIEFIDADFTAERAGHFVTKVKAKDW